MNELPVLANFHYDRIGSWRDGNPFTICFCYTSQQYSRYPAFIVKGGSNAVDPYLESRPFPIVVFRTLWWHGFSRNLSTPTFVNFKKFTVTGQRPYWSGVGQWRIKGGPYFYKHFELKFQRETWTMVRRVPRRWLPDYDKIINACHPLLRGDA